MSRLDLAPAQPSFASNSGSAFVVSGGPDDAHVAALTDLRVAAREAILVAAAAIAPIAVIETGESLPALARAWRVSGLHASQGEASGPGRFAGQSAVGAIAIEPDLIARNAIRHPLWSPARIEIRETADAI